ncbi:hypothetical protein NDU88_006390 [Pleurodeles waltl]|uniref:Uncharacterized protein n=1 Tax=Pleurodeles waltl TaxID=8319 RepID=A0AAV7VLT3_PLEWA|nr:hypothetical protein NDU88_006390 [Pleurodeles waltl]
MADRSLRLLPLEDSLRLLPLSLLSLSGPRGKRVGKKNIVRATLLLKRGGFSVRLPGVSGRLPGFYRVRSRQRFVPLRGSVFVGCLGVFSLYKLRCLPTPIPGVALLKGRKQSFKSRQLPRLGSAANVSAVILG